jgi:molybdate transport system ATP-binding protein
MSMAFQVRSRRGDFTLDVAFETSARAVGVVGPSGAGKTTLLQGLAGLSPADHVRLVVEDEVLVDTASGLVPPAHRRRLGYVFQDGRLFPHMTVGDNVGFARRYVADPLPVEEALALVDLAGFETRWPATLSGGEARRAAIARALVARPRLLLLDEPFTGLDEARKAMLVPYLVRLRDEQGVPLMVVSHDDRDIAALTQTVIRIDAGGRQDF